MHRYKSSDRCCQMSAPVPGDSPPDSLASGREPVNLANRCANALAIALFVTMAIPTPPARATSQNNYNKCTSKLLDAGISPEAVSGLCARALHPQDLANCVLKINEKTDITARDALASCVRVRRPLDLATCVVDISQETQASVAPAILDNCRSSLLPERYSECVVGLTRRVELLPYQAMAICIDAGDRIRDFDPTFIFRDELPVTPPPRLPAPNNPSTSI